MHNEEAIQRLKYIEGHVRGVQRMLEEEKYCIDVIRQIQAIQAALGKVSNLVLDSHLNTCVTTAIRGDNADERERVLTEITSIFSAAADL
jgi:DNA-binding FrmR family transcriptional regulator